MIIKTNRRGRPKGAGDRAKRTRSPATCQIQERISLESQLIYKALNSAGYLLWKQQSCSIWRVKASRRYYEIHFLPNSEKSWCVLPVDRSIVRDRIIALINKALSGEIDGSKPTPSIKE